MLGRGWNAGFQAHAIASQVAQSSKDLIYESMAVNGVYKYLYDLAYYAESLDANSSLRKQIIKKISSIQDDLGIKYAMFDASKAYTGLDKKPVIDEKSSFYSLVNERLQSLSKIPYLSAREKSVLTVEYLNSEIPARLAVIENLMPSDIQQAFIGRTPEAIDAKNVTAVGKELDHLRK